MFKKEDKPTDVYYVLNIWGMSLFWRCVASASSSSTNAPNNVKMMLACELIPTTVTNIQTLPSIPRVPEDVEWTTSNKN